MPDEPTASELARRLDERFADVRDDVRGMEARLDKKVTLERYAYEQQARDEVHRQLTERVRAIEVARKDEADRRQLEAQAALERRAADRRLIFTALIAPVLLLLLGVYLSSKGAGA